MRKILFGFAALAALGVIAADVNRKRDVIFYHYDNLPVFWPKDVPYSADALVNGFGKGRAMDALSVQAMNAEVKIDTYVYVPMGNFANLSVHIPSNEPQMSQASGSSWLRGVKNALPEIKKLGKAHDPISAMSDFVRKKHKKEFFVALCVNDQFLQWGYNPRKPDALLADCYLFNSFKAKHLDWLMGSQKDTPPLKGLKDNYPPFGQWCQVDYDQPEVRAKFVAIATEIINGYEIDGLMIDFCRHPNLFRTVAWGGVASGPQKQLITQMVGQISAVAKKKGILLAVRVPNSQQACRDAGMEVQDWFTQKFADLLFFGDEELNRFSDAGEFAKKCGAPFYVTIENSRIYSHNDEGHREDDQRLPRQVPEVYRARVTEARLAGANGIMYMSGRSEWWDAWWNYTRPELFQPEQEKIRLENKRYFVNYRTGAYNFIRGLGKYSTIQGQVLNTAGPREIKGTAKYDIYVWDDLDKIKSERKSPKCYLTTIMEIPSGWTVDVKVNNKPLKLLKKRAGSQIFALPANNVLFGKNEILLSVKGSNRRGLVPRIGNIGIDVIFNGDLEALSKSGNMPGALSTAGGGNAEGGSDKKSGAGKNAKKGGRK